MSFLRPKSSSVFLAVLAGVAYLGISDHASARDKYDCQQAWSRAVRSYLTQNRTAGPDGKVPANMDEIEIAAQAWAEKFAPACDLEAQGKGDDARVEAAMLGAQSLAKLDPRGCVRFLDSYMQSTRADDICGMATTAGTEDLRKRIAGSIPPRKSKR